MQTERITRIAQLTFMTVVALLFTADVQAGIIIFLTTLLSWAWRIFPS
jgi:hypothetical protein